MTEREMALCDLAFAHGMKLASVMLAQGADAKVRTTIERLTSESLRALKRPTRAEVALACERHG